MSTKIYTGFKINHTDYFNFMQSLIEFRLKAKENILSKLHKVLKDKNSEEVGKFFEDLYCQHEEINKSMRRGFELDWSCEICLIPAQTYILGIVYSESSEWYVELLNMEGVQEYRYWNNSDPPQPQERYEQYLTEKVAGYTTPSEEEFYARKKTWKEALLDKPHVQGIPALGGLVYNICSIDPKCANYIGLYDYLEYKSNLHKES